MKKLIASLALVALIVGCASQQRTTYNTLASIESLTTGAFDSYLNLVVTGKLTTNSVPVVAKDYNTFKVVWTTAVVIASGNTNAPSTATVSSASATVLADIATAKKGTP